MNYTAIQISNQIYSVRTNWEIMSNVLYNVSINALISNLLSLEKFTKIDDDIPYKEMLVELNMMYMGINKCLLSLQNPEYLRIEVREFNLYNDVCIYKYDTFLSGKQYKKSNYMSQVYERLIDHYTMVPYRKVIEYKKIMDREDILESLLNGE